MNPFEAEIFVQRVDLTGSEVGTNDLRVSQAGPDGNSAYDATSPSVTYNSVVNEYLVAWSGSDDAPPLVAGELEIFVQRLDGNTAAEIGGDLRVSDLGPDGDPDYNASSPDVAYDPASDTYLVTWSGDDHNAPLAANESEIFGQFLNGTAQEIGDNDVRLSDAGADGVGSRADAIDPAVATGAGSTFLTVWDANDDTVSPMTYEENEIFGQFIAADVAADVGASDDVPGSPPQSLQLDPVRPNPARQRAEAVLRLARPMQARVRLVDLTGRTVLTFGSRRLEAGAHVLAFSLREGRSSLPAGVYFLEVVGDDTRASRKVIVK